MATAQEEVTLDQFEIHVKQIGKGEAVLSFFIDATANVLDLKKKISSQLQQSNDEDVPTDRQRLIFSGRMLRADEENLKDARMKTDSINCIHLTPLPAGAKPSVRDEDERSGPSEAAAAHLRGARERRRIRLESMRAGFHPYAFAIPARMLAPEGSSTAGGENSTNNNNNNDGSSTARIRSVGVARVSRSTGRYRVSQLEERAAGSSAEVQGATINLTAEAPPFFTMIERSIARSAAIQESAQRLRRAALDQLLAFTSSSPFSAGEQQQQQPTRSSVSTARPGGVVRVDPGGSSRPVPAETRRPRLESSSAPVMLVRSRRRPREATTSEPPRRSTRRRGNPESSS